MEPQLPSRSRDLDESPWQPMRGWWPYCWAQSLREQGATQNTSPLATACDEQTHGEADWRTQRLLFLHHFYHWHRFLTVAQSVGYCCWQSVDEVRGVCRCRGSWRSSSWRQWQGLCAEGWSRMWACAHCVELSDLWRKDIIIVILCTAKGENFPLR